MLDGLVYDFVFTNDESEAYGILWILINRLLAVYDEEREAFAKSNDITLDGYSDETEREDYTAYLLAIYVGMRQREREKAENLQIDGATGTALAIQMEESTRNAFDLIDSTEHGNATQMGQLSAVDALTSQRSDVKIYKQWVAHPDCCEICKNLDGTVIPINAPFLVNGQIVELEDGKEFEYKYIDRLICCAHPNDKCRVEFIVEY